MARHVRKGDQVVVISGKEKGQSGTVLRVLTDQDRVLVQGVNVRTKNLRRSQQNPNGGVIHKEMPIHISNVAPLVAGKPSRVRFNTDASGRKTRVAVVDGSVLGPDLKKGSKRKKAEKA